ncbi:WD40 repeat-like protein [Sistotremastrum suecicum HHB10207 ss-3]|uniref:WD40 repeat-like protein n=1 Tax=Sistotremastrum suecicum HHB10207 ss-3 TaxID=1314776 RepID=A0A165ZVF3_9AGAM|nr:WD40 repeat-like protein [Sistotremastrum suecicum HHB10207 ss-3]
MAVLLSGRIHPGPRPCRCMSYLCQHDLYALNAVYRTRDDLSGSLTVKIYLKHLMGMSKSFFGTLTEDIKTISAEIEASVSGNDVHGWTKPRRLVTGDSIENPNDSMPTLSFKFIPLHAPPPPPRQPETASEDSTTAATSTSEARDPDPAPNSDLERLRKAKEAAQKAVESLKKPPSELQKSSDYSDVAKSAADLLAPVASDASDIMEKMSIFVGVVDTVADIHPYAKLAWGVISLPFKIGKAQLDRDQELSDLVDSINSAYENISRLWTSLEQDYQRKIVTKLLIHSTECGAFLCEECIAHPDFFKRALRSSFTGVDRKIQDFKSGFKDLRDDLLRSTALEAQVVGQKIYTSVRDTGDQAILDKLNYVAAADFGSKSGCYPNTRVTLMDEITQWFEAPKSTDGRKPGASIYWLRGHAGSGKSAIAHTIAEKYHKEGRLGSSFFFDASNSVKRRAEDLFSTIARNLAAAIPSFGEALADVIKKSSEIRTSTSVRRQFEDLVLGPAQKSRLEGHVLIVIDALDECGYSLVRERDFLLDILSCSSSCSAPASAVDQSLPSRFSLKDLPPNFHFFLTSRPEQDLEDAFKFVPPVQFRQQDLWTVSDKDLHNDLNLYHEYRLRPLFVSRSGLRQAFDDRSPTRDCIRALTDKAEGLFQWAFTASEFLLEKRLLDEELEERFSSLLISSQLNGLDELYVRILQKVVGVDASATRLRQFTAVLGRVLCVRTPLPSSDIQALRGENERETTTQFFLGGMGSLLSGVSSDSPVQVFHTSFRDFLFRRVFSEHRENPYYIDPSDQERTLAEACLRVLNLDLQFNICGFQTSYASQDAEVIKNAKASLRSRGLGHLIYASVYWADHIAKTSYNEELSSLLHTFVDSQFLHWLELLGSIGEIYVAIGAIRSTTEWATGHDDKLAKFGKDAGKFVSNFADVIARSPPHLYLSALPFAPKSSLISQRYLPQFRDTLNVKIGQQQIWSPVDLVFGDRGDFRTKRVLSMAYSPDGTILIAVTNNGLVWLWNPSTGQSIASFSETEASPACIVEISPDGQYFAVGSQRGEIVLRDIKTQRLIWGPKRLWSQKIVSLRFSPDSEKLWAGDEWAYTGAWEISSGNNVGSVEKLHSDSGDHLVISIDTTCLACAPAGKSLVLFHWNGSDTTWSDRRTLTTFTDEAFALTFSPDGQRLVSGHNSGAVKIWDVESGDLLGDQSASHSGQICSLTSSSDRSLFVSASFDQTIRLWDGKTGDPIGNAVSGFGEVHRKIAISADGKSVTTVIADGGIYVWDTAGMKQSALLDAKSGTREPYPSIIALSPDGKHLYAARSDHSICEYDMETGAELGTVMRGHRSRIWHLSVSSDGTNLVSCSSDTTISIWDIKTQMQTNRPLTGHTNDVVFTAFNPDGTLLLSCSTDRTLRIWDTTSWEMIGAPLTGHTAPVNCALFFDAGKRIMSGSTDRTIRIWDAENRIQIGESLELHTGGVTAMALSPTDDIVASADTSGVIYLWYPATATSSLQRHHIIQHGIDEITSVAFSADGARLLSASADHTIRLWDVSTRELIGRPFEGHSGWVRRAFFLHEERIISSSEHGTIRIWNIEDESETPELKPIGDSQRSFSRIDYDGWVRSEHDPPRLLFWLPLHYRPIFQWSRCQKIIGREALDIDFSRFEHGERWMHCRSSMEL